MSLPQGTNPFPSGLTAHMQDSTSCWFQKKLGGFFRSGWFVSYKVATRCPEEGRQSGAGGDAEQSGHGEKHGRFPIGARSAPLCLLCTYGVGRGPRRGSKYCEKRWGFPWRSAIARFPPAGSQPAQPFQDAGALQASEKTREHSMPQSPVASSPSERSEPACPHPQASGEPPRQPRCRPSSPPRLAEAPKGAGC